MTETEATRIEAEFALRIPPQWRALLTDAEACARLGRNTRTWSRGAPCVGLLLEYEDLRRENRFLRDAESLRAYWRPEWLAIHSDGCGNVYFVDTLSPTAVFELDHEKVHPGYDPLEREVFPGIEALLAHVENERDD